MKLLIALMLSSMSALAYGQESYDRWGDSHVQMQQMQNDQANAIQQQGNAQYQAIEQQRQFSIQQQQQNDVSRNYQMPNPVYGYGR